MLIFAVRPICWQRVFADFLLFYYTEKDKMSQNEQKRKKCNFSQPKGSDCFNFSMVKGRERENKIKALNILQHIIVQKMESFI